MGEKWLGSIISIDCGDVLGTFDGEISSIDDNNETISLTNVSRNSIKCQVPGVTLRTSDIKNLKILQSTACLEAKNNCISPSKASAFVQPSPSKNNCRNSPPPDENHEKKSNGKKKPAKRSDSKKWTKKKDEDCFSVPVDSDVLDTEFDFEKNLALFDKKAVFNEINAHSKSDHVKLVDCNKRPQTKYRHDENVLNSDAPILKQIYVPCKVVKEYVTDAGLIVPSVSVRFKKLLYRKAEEIGIGVDVRLEMIGRAASEIVLQLLGGNHRINPQNIHQKPTVIVLCGPHEQGAQGMNSARHLANHGVNVAVLSPPLASDPLIQRELPLLTLSGCTMISDISGLSSNADIIISALDSLEEKSSPSTWLNNAHQWTKQCKSPILSLDPPPIATSIEPKWILTPVLPFAFKSDKSSIYICDIGFPKGIFMLVDSTYSSPFGSKFIIPIHARAS